MAKRGVLDVPVVGVATSEWNPVQLHEKATDSIMNILYFRFCNSFLESIWNRNYLASVQITLSKDFGAEGRGAFYETER